MHIVRTVVRHALVMAFLLTPSSRVVAAQGADEIARVFDNVGAVYDIAILIEEHRIEHGAWPKAANLRELSQARFKSDFLVGHVADTYQTPLHIESTPGKGYLVVAAGADGTFDRSSWSSRAHTQTAADDIVLRDGVLVRSPIAWAMKAAASAADLSAGADEASAVARHQRAVSNLRSIASEVLTYQVLNNRLPTAKSIDALAQALGSHIPRTDGWDRPLHVAADGRQWLIVSAGPDGQLNAASWTDPSVPSDDIVLRDGTLVRNEMPPKASAGGRLADSIAGHQMLRARFEKMRQR